MKVSFIVLTLLVLTGVFVWLVTRNEVPAGSSVEYLLSNEQAEVNESSSTSTPSVPPTSVVATGLTIPWDIAFLPDDSMLITERPGRVVHLESGRTYPVDGVAHVGEGGLLGIALHPQFTENRYVYLYQTTETTAGLQNRVVRYTYENEELSFDRVIFDSITGARYHDGGRIAFGPDGLLYITVGDAGTESAAQNPESLAGSILRITPEGEVPDGNPFGNAIYSYGHRNPQGLAWDVEGRLWSTEHGRSGVQSGFDELNLIMPGANYGWPEIEGDALEPGADGPILHSGAATTWAPASAAFHEGSIYFGGLRGQTLYEAVLEGIEVVELREHLVGEYGRIRTVTVGPDGLLYLTTSNRDGRGSPVAEDDRVIRVDPAQL